MDRSKFHILENGCQAFGVTLTEKQIEQFEKYYELLIEWNKVMNLTGITEFDEVMQKHFVDSVAAAEYVEMEKINSLIDVGTGAGFPGIPLKIVYPHLQVTLLDSLNKRIKFLDEVVDNLGLTGIETVHGRAEDAAKKAEYREQLNLFQWMKKSLRVRRQFMCLAEKSEKWKNSICREVTWRGHLWLWKRREARRRNTREKPGCRRKSLLRECAKRV